MKGKLDIRGPVSRVTKPTCVFCDSTIDKPQRIHGGGRASFCKHCLTKLEENGALAKVGDGTIELREALFDIIADYAVAMA